MEYISKFPASVPILLQEMGREVIIIIIIIIIILHGGSTPVIALTAAMTTRENLRALNCETLRLRLAQGHLSQVGKKEVLVERLFQHLQASERAGEEDGSESDSSISTVESAHIDSQPEVTPLTKSKHRRTHRPAPAGSAVGGIASAAVRKPTAGLPATTLRDSTSAWASGSKRSRHQPSSASSESSSESTSSSSESSDSEDTSSDSDRRRRRRRRDKRHRRHRRSAHGHRQTYPQVLASPLISCVPTPDKRAIRKIRKGKYVIFDTLLPPLDDGQVGQAAKKGTNRRQVTNLSSWMEAWNIFAATRIQTAPQTALELVKYQNIICQLFAAYSTAAALKYDRLFRQAVARDKRHTLRWDILKEDILVWCVTHQPFRARQQPAPSRPTTTTAGTALSTSTTPAGGFHHPERATHNAGQEICRRFNFGRCNKGAECYFAHKCWVTGCGGEHSAKACPRAAPVAQ